MLGRASNTEIYRPLENHNKVRGRSYCIQINILFENWIFYLKLEAHKILISIDAAYPRTKVLFSFQCYEVPGVKILTYNGPIYYGNRSFFREEMSRLLGLTPEKIRSREKARKVLEKREREATVNTVVRLL